MSATSNAAARSRGLIQIEMKMAFLLQCSLSKRNSTVVVGSVPALEAEACECYQLLKKYLNNYVQFDTGFVV